MSDETRQPQRPPEPGPRRAWVPGEAPSISPASGSNGQEGTGGRPQVIGGTPPGGYQPHNAGTQEDENAGEGRITYPAATGGTPIKIGLWGSPGSGKTTYLASLPKALSSADQSIGKWAIWPKGPASAALLKQWNRRLTMEQLFPDPTQVGNVVNLAWRFVGDLTGSRYKRGAFRRLPAKSEFDLDVIDVSGEIFGDSPTISQEKIDIALNHLVQAEGLIFLFDPITERDKHTAFEYMSSTLVELSLRIESEGRRIGQHLPHYIAVCITKFDHEDVFTNACEAGLVNYGPDGIPRVIGDHAEEMFNAMCEGRFWPDRKDSHGGALFVKEKLREYFQPSRIRYYATSSIGFKKTVGWDPKANRLGFQFDPDNYVNFDERDGTKRILGPIMPINVLEPLVELQMQITGRA